MAKPLNNNTQRPGAQAAAKSARQRGAEPSGKTKEIVKVSRENLPLEKTNFLIMAAAALLIVVGFVLMAGGGSTTDKFDPEIFSTRRIVVAPTIAFLGFVLMGIAIVWRPGKFSLGKARKSGSKGDANGGKSDAAGIISAADSNTAPASLSAASNSFGTAVDNDATLINHHAGDAK